MSANAGEIRARLVLSNEEFKRKMNETREDMKKTSFSAQQMNKDFTAIQKGSAIMGGAVAAVIGGSVKVAADFEQSMAKVQAISGATGSEFASLEKVAREMGAATIFSASEAAEGLSYLAMAGFDVEQQIGSLPAVLNAAIAGNMGLGDSANIVTNIMSAFGLTAEESGHAVDVLAKAANSANTDIPLMGEAFKMVAPVASALGFSIEETAAAIGELGNVGISGSQAGTVLRAALLALANPTGQTKDAMEDLNIEVLNAEGNMKSLPELIGHVSDRMKGLTDAQKTQYAAQLVGTQAASGFIALLEVGEDGLKDFTTELENSAGTAQKMADIQSDTLVGAFKEFQSAMEEAGIKLGNEFLPLFTDVVRFGSDIVNTFTEIDAGQAKTVLAFAGTAAAIGMTISTIGKLVIAARGLMASMGPAGWLVMGLSIIGGLIAANKVQTEEAIEVNLDHARSLKEESESIEEQITRFDALQEANKLSNDELAEFVDLQTRIKLETDPEKIEAMQQRYDELQEKSGMTNEQMAEFLQLNDDILQKVPNSNVILTDQGNILLDNTDAAKAYNKQLERELELELRKQANNASQQLLESIKERADALLEINETAEKYISVQERIANQEQIIAKEELLHADAIKSGDESRIRLAEERVAEEEKQLELLENQSYRLMEQLIENEEIVNEIELQILKGQEAYQELINYHLKQVDIVAEKGKEVETIDKAIKKLRDQREEIRKNHTEDGKLTEEGRKQLGLIDEQVSELQNARTAVSNLKDEQDRLTNAIDDSLGVSMDLNYDMEKDIQKQFEVYGYTSKDADELNEKLSQPVNKRVSVVESVTRAISNVFSGPSYARHGGGLVNDGRSTGIADIVTRQKLHSGGLPSRLAAAPMHNEIDVRLLRDEMVLTEGQQANLFRMISNGQSGNSDNKYLKDLLHTSLKQYQVMTQLLQKDNSLYVDGRELASVQTPHVTEIQNTWEEVVRLFKEVR